MRWVPSGEPDDRPHRPRAGTGTVAAPGQTMTKTYKGFKAFEKVTLVLHSTPVTLGTFTADGVLA